MVTKILSCIVATSLVLASANSSPLHAPTRRALLVGINIYQYYKKPRAAHIPKSSGHRVWTNLDGCVNDVTAIGEVIVARYGFERKNIHMLTDATATRTRILSEIQKQLIKPSKAGDLCLFYFAGHGSQVKNRATSEPSGKDQTIVPADSITGARDIRDKELARLFNKLLDKRVVLTAIFDSCHSGSIARGLRHRNVRVLPPDPRAVSDPFSSPLPEERGALVLSASQHDQLAEEDPNAIPEHGAFSYALLKTLRTAPVTESAEQVFLQVKALLQSNDSIQEPVMGGPRDGRRFRQPLFGGLSGSLNGGTVVAVRNIDSPTSIRLQGGTALGLVPGCELRKTLGGVRGGGLRLRIVKITGLNSCTAKLIAGNALDLKIGDLMEVDRWVALPEANMRVWVPPANLTYAALLQVARDLEALRHAANVRWIDDPMSDPATHVVYWDGTYWKLLSPGGGQSSLGKRLTARAITERLESLRAKKPKLFVHFPPSKELASVLRLGSGNTNSIEITSRDKALYYLVGRSAANRLEYAWIRPNGMKVDENRSSLPLSTDWIVHGTEEDSQSDHARKLRDYILRIGKVKAWLTLQAPPQIELFPYRLAMRNVETRANVTAGSVIDKERYGFVLLADQEMLDKSLMPERRFVYVFSIDSAGNSTLLFPDPGRGTVENMMPYTLSAEPPAEIQLGSKHLFTISEPFGVDTYIMISSREALPNPKVLEFHGVKTRGDRGGKETILQRLLADVGTSTRGQRREVPRNWSIQRLVIRSVRN